MLRERDFRQILATVRDLHLPRTVEEFGRNTLNVLPQIVANERTAYNDVNLRDLSFIGMSAPPTPSPSEVGLLPQLLAHIHQHPVVAHLKTNAADAPRRISDFSPQRDWHRTTLYNEFYRPLQTEEQIVVSLKIESHRMVVFTLSRSRRSFTPRDCALLETLRPHLIQAYENAVVWSQVQDELAMHQASWNSLSNGLMIVSPHGRMIFCNASGKALLHTYFGTRRRQDALPAFIADWVKSQNETSLTAIAPLRISRADRTLVARRVAHSATHQSSGALVLLAEEVRDSVHKLAQKLAQKLGLTPRQSEVLLLLTRGHTNDQIAVQLTLSRFTVKRHLEAVYEKLQVSSRNAAAQRAHQALNLAIHAAQNTSFTTFSLPSSPPER